MLVQQHLLVQFLVAFSVEFTNRVTSHCLYITGYAVAILVWEMLYFGRYFTCLVVVHLQHPSFFASITVSSAIDNQLVKLILHNGLVV
jgi:hypothetical protein